MTNLFEVTAQAPNVNAETRRNGPIRHDVLYPGHRAVRLYRRDGAGRGYIRRRRILHPVDRFAAPPCLTSTASRYCAARRARCPVGTRSAAPSSCSRTSRARTSRGFIEAGTRLLQQGFHPRGWRGGVVTGESISPASGATAYPGTATSRGLTMAAPIRVRACFTNRAADNLPSWTSTGTRISWSAVARYAGWQAMTVDVTIAGDYLNDKSGAPAHTILHADRTILLRAYSCPMVLFLTRRSHWKIPSDGPPDALPGS